MITNVLDISTSNDALIAQTLLYHYVCIIYHEYIFQYYFK